MQRLKHITAWTYVAIFGTGYLLYRGTLILDRQFGFAEIATIAMWLVAICDIKKDRAWARPIGMSVLLAFAALGLSMEASFSMIVAAALCVWSALTEFKVDKEDSSDDEPMQSIVLLENETRYLDATILSRLMSEAWQIEVKLGEDDSTEEDSPESDTSDDEAELTSATLFGDTAPFMCMYWPALFIIHNHSAPYVDDVESLVNSVPDVRLKEAISSHTSWLSVDLLKWMGEDEERGRKVADKLIGQLLAELCDDTCVAVLDLLSGRIYPTDPELIEKLQDENPREALANLYYPPITAISGDDPELIAAVEEATTKWPEFVKTFENRHEDSSCESFSIKAPFGDEDDPEFMWVSVSAIEGDVIYGELGNDPAQVTSLKAGDKVNVPLSDLNDWMFLRDGEIVGGFTVEILMKRYRQAADEGSEPPAESDD